MRGFTLIELAIVIVIAGILAAVAIPIYQSLVDDAKISEAQTTLGSLKTACDTHRARYGDYNSTAGPGGPTADAKAGDVFTTLDMTVDQTNWTYTITVGAGTLLIEAAPTVGGNAVGLATQSINQDGTLAP